jgi:hypothetical protein
MFSEYLAQYGIASSLPGKKKALAQQFSNMGQIGPFLFSGRRHSRGDRAYIVFDSRTIPALEPSASGGTYTPLNAAVRPRTAHPAQSVCVLNFGL